MFEIHEYLIEDHEACARRLWIEVTQHHRDIYDAPTIGGDDPKTGLLIEHSEAEIEPVVRPAACNASAMQFFVTGLTMHERDWQV